MSYYELLYCLIVYGMQEPLPGEIICPRDQRRRQSAYLSLRWVKNSKFRFYHLLLRYLSFYYFNCSLQCQSFEVWKGSLGIQFRLLNFSKWLPAPSSVKSEFRVNPVNFEMEENDQIISEKRQPLVLRA